MDGDGDGVKTPFPLCDVVISISPPLLFCGAWGSIYIEAPSQKSLGLMRRRRWTPIQAPIRLVLPVWLLVKPSSGQQREPFDFGVLETHNSLLIHLNFVIIGCIPERKRLKRILPHLVVISH
jgi:hypothetical protein